MTSEFSPTAEQQQVIGLENGRYMVLGNPGCGKTELLTRRIIRAAQQGTPYEHMLCLTFTNRASREMKERIAQKISDNTDSLFVGNLHSFCHMFLLQNGIISPQTVTIDEVQQKEILATFIQTPWYNEQNAVINIAALRYQEQHNFPIEYRYNSNVDTRRFHPSFHLHESVNQYIQFKEDHQVVDYNDLLLLTYNALQEEDYQLKYQYAAYPWIQVDEVQDLTPFQLGIIRKLEMPSDFNSTVLYFGDRGQSIFSWAGATPQSLQQLADSCDATYHLTRNFRSNAYLIDMLTDYAVQNNIIPQLPSDAETPVNCNKECMTMTQLQWKDHYNYVAALARTLHFQHPDDSIAILVRTNRSGNSIDEALDRHGVEHIFISADDIFKNRDLTSLVSHFAVVMDDTNILGWNALQHVLYNSMNSYGRFGYDRMLADAAMCPTDFMDYTGSCYSMEFTCTFLQNELVIFQTETAGDGGFDDDITRIAAVKIENGCKLPDSDILITIDADDPQSGFAQFLEYAGTDPLLSYHVRDQYIRLRRNISRRCQGVKITKPELWDLYKMCRLLFPYRKSYTLNDMIHEQELPVRTATLQDQLFAIHVLANFCTIQAQDKEAEQQEMLEDPSMQTFRDRLKPYRNLYHHTRQLLFQDYDDEDHSLLSELRYAHDYLVNLGTLEPIRRIDQLFRFYRSVMIQPDESQHIYSQLTLHLHELTSYNESDLLQYGIVQEKVYVMTVHKAKGMQFDHVIVHDVTNGVYPASWEGNPEESKRVLYVAMSRARKQLHLTIDYMISPYITERVQQHFYQVPEGQAQRLLQMENIWNRTRQNSI